MSGSRSRSSRRFSRSESRRSNRSELEEGEQLIDATVERINFDRGFGFLRVSEKDAEEDNEEIFFHSNDVQGMDIRKLRVGDKVKCKTGPSKKRADKREARRVIALDEDAALDRLEKGRKPSRRPRSRSRSRRRSRSRSRGRGRGRYRSRSPSYRRRSPSMNEEGTVLRINERGFGFIGPRETDEELFFHTHHLEDGIDIRQLRPGDAVDFTTCKSTKHPGKREARRVWVLDRNVRQRQMRGRRPSPRRRRSRSLRSRSRSRR